MAARAAILGDTGESAPEHWELPLGHTDAYMAYYMLAPDASRLEALFAGVCDALLDVHGIMPFGDRTPTCCRTSELR